MTPYLEPFSINITMLGLESIISWRIHVCCKNERLEFHVSVLNTNLPIKLIHDFLLALYQTDRENESSVERFIAFIRGNYKTF
jgi:hypothetical protein